MIDYPNKLNKIFDKLQKNGAFAIIVGGYVRDRLLQIDSKDIDIEVYGVSSFEKLKIILEEFGSINTVGKSFGVCKLYLQDLELDFTLPRIEEKIAIGHTGFEINIESDIDFTTAARRRDFTINSIGYDVTHKKILDPFYGIDDLKNKILRAVDKKSFVEDPLRVYRAVQFCCRFGLQMDKELFGLCSMMVANNMLSELSKERVFQEIEKLLLKAQMPSLGFKLYEELGIIKSFDELHFLTQSHWNQILHTLDNLAKQKTANKTTNITLMLAAICYKLGREKTTSFIIKLTDEKKILHKVLSLVLNPITELLSDSDLYRLAIKVTIEDLLTLTKAVFQETDHERYRICEINHLRAQTLGILHKKIPPLLKGKDILACGISPSKKFSTILKQAYEGQIEGKFHSHEDGMIWLKKYLA